MKSTDDEQQWPLRAQPEDKSDALQKGSAFLHITAAQPLEANA